MKLVVQIPCLNEADTLPVTLAEIPRHIAGVDDVEVLVVDGRLHRRDAPRSRQNMERTMSSDSNARAAWRLPSARGSTPR